MSKDVGSGMVRTLVYTPHGMAVVRSVNAWGNGRVRVGVTTTATQQEHLVEEEDIIWVREKRMTA
jgi:hypothetical protein